jgi:hypothetical protein
MAGWMATDLGQHARGQRYLLLALRAAQTADDRLLGANIVSCLSYQAAWTGARHEALRLIQVARKAAPRPHTGSAHALLATRQGRAHAQLHQADDCRRALDEAGELAEHADAAVDPPWSYWVTPAVLAADAGRAWLEFGRPDLAEQNLLRGLKLFGDAQPRNRLLHLMSLAEARLARDDAEGAVEAAHPALDLIGRFDSRRARIRLRAVAEGFARFDSAAARDVTDRIDTVLST